MAKVIVKIRDKILKEVQLNKESTLTIGRDPSNDVHLDNPAVSRFHAKIYKQDWPFYIEDLDSTNGTILNGKKVSWKNALNNNDNITVGKHTLVFVDKKSDYENQSVKGDTLQIDSTICVTKKST